MGIEEKKEKLYVNLTNQLSTELNNIEANMGTKILFATEKINKTFQLEKKHWNL